MLFITYQCSDYETYKNPRNEELKSLLGIPQEKNMYWCIAANTVEQAVINSFAIEPNQPFYMVMFETDNYYKLDKIKWNRVAEDILNEREYSITEDLLDVEHEDAVEYIVTDIPKEKYFCRLDLLDLIDSAGSVQRFSEERISAAADDVAEYMVPINEITSYYLETAEKLSLSYSTSQYLEPVLKDMKVRFLVFRATVLAGIYTIGYRMLKGIPLNFEVTVSTSTWITSIVNDYPKLMISIPKLTNDNVYAGLHKIYKNVYLTMFYRRPYADMKIGPNEPCPCGSGKKFKKCCSRLPEPDIYSIMTKGLIV